MIDNTILIILNINNHTYNNIVNNKIIIYVYIIRHCCYKTSKTNKNETKTKQQNKTVKNIPKKEENTIVSLYSFLKF